MGKYFWAERIFERLEHSRLQIEVSQIIIHETDEPDVVVHFPWGRRPARQRPVFVSGDGSCYKTNEMVRERPDVLRFAMQKCLRLFTSHWSRQRFGFRREIPRCDDCLRKSAILLEHS